MRTMLSDLARSLRRSGFCRRRILFETQVTGVPSSFHQTHWTFNQKITSCLHSSLLFILQVFSQMAPPPKSFPNHLMQCCPYTPIPKPNHSIISYTLIFLHIVVFHVHVTFLWFFIPSQLLHILFTIYMSLLIK